MNTKVIFDYIRQYLGSEINGILNGLSSNTIDDKDIRFSLGKYRALLEMQIFISNTEKDINLSQNGQTQTQEQKSRTRTVSVSEKNEIEN